MASATHHTPTSVRLPQRLVQDLQKFAEQQGKSDFRKIVKTWIEERLRQEANATH
jgi:predicted DNA-binding protein